MRDVLLALLSCLVKIVRDFDLKFSFFDFITTQILRFFLEGRKNTIDRHQHQPFLRQII